MSKQKDLDAMCTAALNASLGTWCQSVYTLLNEIKTDLNTHVAQTASTAHGTGSAVVSISGSSISSLG